MELLDRDSGAVGRIRDVADESLEFEHPGQPVLRPQQRRQPATVGRDQHELHLMPDECGEAGSVQTVLHPLQHTAAAVRVERSVLVVEGRWGPSESVTQDPQGAEVDADPLIPHHSDVPAHRDTGLIDGERVKHRAGAQTRIREGAHPAQRNGFRVGQPRRTGHRTDQRRDPVGFQLRDGGRSQGFRRS